MRKTDTVKAGDVKRAWHLVDVSDQVLGRVATQIAQLLMGKLKVNRSPNIDSGDYVVVINSDKIGLTRGKESKKFYHRHSGYPGGLKTIRFDKQMEKDSTFVIRQAVLNMLPKNKHRDIRMGRLYVYPTADHKNQGQTPVEFKLSE